MKNIVIALLMLVAFTTANAAPITFGWSSNGSGSEIVSGSGSWTIDDSLLVDGFNDYKLDIFAFDFNWTALDADLNLDSFSSSLASGDFIARAFMTLDGLDVLGFDICVSNDGSCAARTGHPLLRITNNFWGATRANNDSDFVFLKQTAAAIPEPAMFSLFAIGIIGLGLSRRRSRFTNR